MTELTEVNCPECGNGSVATLAKMKPAYSTHTVEHIDGGEVDFLNTWDRFYCDDCGSNFAVRQSETELESRADE